MGLLKSEESLLVGLFRAEQGELVEIDVVPVRLHSSGRQQCFASSKSKPSLLKRECMRIVTFLRAKLPEDGSRFG